MKNSISTGAILYMVGATLLLIYFSAQWRAERDEARANVADLYAVCLRLRVLAPHLVSEAPIPLTPAAAIAQATDKVAIERASVTRICNDKHVEEFERLQRRAAIKAKG
jgi:hypothetical protein